MRRGWILLALSASLFAESAQMGKITVEDTITKEIVTDVSGREIKSADLAEALGKNLPSVNIIRRSGIANDILLRGQKRDNINIIVDGTKVYGACVNRMDPPTSHILTNNIDTVEVSEGPFDVENFGTLSGLVNIRTLKPTKDLRGEINVNAGSWEYRKLSGRISGGNDRIKVLVSASREQSGQYRDGDGDDFVGQIAKNIAAGVAPAMAQYQDRYRNLDAYQKSTLMTKLFVDLTDDQELRLGYTANRSDKVLYPSSKMDALYDDSDIYNLEYIARALGRYSQKLDLRLYQSKVDHPMSTKYRKMGAKNYKTHALTTKMQGAKLKNSFALAGLDWTIGLDGSRRNWDGHFEMNGKPMIKNGMLVKSLDDVDTTDAGIFLKATQKIGNIDMRYGVRYDDVAIDSSRRAERDNDYSSVTGNLLATIHADETLDWFAGVGKSTRVPDARELYLTMAGVHYGTPTLDQTTNYEIDLGFEKRSDMWRLKTKAYYSMLKDYIAYNASKKGHNFENVDAKIYGMEIGGDLIATDTLWCDFALAYKRGKKDNPLTGQQGRDMPDMRPFKANIALNYDYDDATTARLSFVGATRWDKIDYENGEQKLPGYGVLNFKASRSFAKGFKLTLGVDNMLDKTYAITNTYKDLVLLTAGNGVDNVMLLNEPGRYFYLQGSYAF